MYEMRYKECGEELRIRIINDMQDNDCFIFASCNANFIDTYRYNGVIVQRLETVAP